MLFSYRESPLYYLLSVTIKGLGVSKGFWKTTNEKTPDLVYPTTFSMKTLIDSSFLDRLAICSMSHARSGLLSNRKIEELFFSNLVMIIQVYNSYRWVGKLIGRHFFSCVVPFPPGLIASMPPFSPNFSNIFSIFSYRFHYCHFTIFKLLVNTFLFYSLRWSVDFFASCSFFISFLIALQISVEGHWRGPAKKISKYIVIVISCPVRKWHKLFAITE